MKGNTQENHVISEELGNCCCWQKDNDNDHIDNDENDDSFNDDE